MAQSNFKNPQTQRQAHKGAAIQTQQGMSRGDFAGMLLGIVLAAGLMAVMLSPQSVIVPGIVLVYCGCKRFSNVGWIPQLGLLWLVPVIGLWAMISMPLSRNEAWVCLISSVILGAGLCIVSLFKPSLS
jgi:hypothetical protein